MSSSIQRRKYSGPAILSKGFRPFFLGAIIWAAISLILWIFILSATFDLPSMFGASEWHIHEMLFGYSGAVFAGFLLTAIPNWTGRFPICGKPLLGLFSIWLIGRIVIFFSASLNPFLVLAIDIAFPLLLSLAIGIEIIAGKNWRNLRVLAILSMFTIADIFFHFEFFTDGMVQYSAKLALSAIIMMIMLIGGRIIPSFTRNWLVRFKQSHLPTPFNRFDYFAMAISILALLLWVFLENTLLLGALLFLAFIFNLIRLSRWAGLKTTKEPMLFILHIGFLFIPLGFLALSINVIFPDIISQAGAIHLFSAGAIGTMSVAMMSRVSLAHSGFRPEADKIIGLIYILLIISVILRFLADFLPSISFIIHISATFWIASFLLFLLRYWRVLFASRS